MRLSRRKKLYNESMHWKKKAWLKRTSAKLSFPVIQALGVSMRPSFNGFFYNGRGEKNEKNYFDNNAWTYYNFTKCLSSIDCIL